MVFILKAGWDASGSRVPDRCHCRFGCMNVVLDDARACANINI